MPSKTFLALEEEKKNKIIEISLEEMRTYDYDKISVNRIAKNCDISHGSFYTYFKDKDDLLEYIYDEKWQKMLEDEYDKFMNFNGDVKPMAVEFFRALTDFFISFQFKDYTHLVKWIFSKNGGVVSLLEGEEMNNTIFDFVVEVLIQKGSFGENVDRSKIKQGIFIVIGQCFIAVSEILGYGFSREECEKLLEKKIDIILYGLENKK